ncbi:MAG TPA: carboxypeptidase regulatory-like domain-containing protein [Bryobacteraceae bacterium]|nr:carboxypeptidase regulatory-like domain-containing protein [Bryobacteraceae bacterium]
MRSRFTWLLLALCVSAAPSLWGQVQAGRIVGTVMDPNNAVVPNAAVTITNKSTDQSFPTTTNSVGDYTVTPLNPGVYTVRVVVPGFQTAVVDNVEVVVGQSARADVNLRIGQTDTSVEVTAAAPLLDSQSGTLGHVITNEAIVNLPLNGRSFYELARLTPGAALLPGGGNLLRIRANYWSGESISGVRGRQTTFLLDGVDVTDHHQGGTEIQTSIDALQEFQVQQSEYSAEVSHAGGVLNATTKSGTNQVHGGLFEFLRNDTLDARDFFAPTRGSLKRNQFGGTLGGPVVIPHVFNGKNNTFFFMNYEGMRERQGLVFNNIVPTAAMKTGDFSAAGLNAIYDPLTTSNGTRQPFPDNKIPSGRLSPQAVFFNKYIPDPNLGTNHAAFVPTRSLDFDQFMVRGDRTINDNNRLFIRWSWNNYQQIDPNAFPALGTAPLNTRGQNVAAALTSNIRSTLVHEARFSYNPQWIDLSPFLLGTNFNQQAGIAGFEETARPGVVGSFPDFSWSGYAGASGSAFDQRPKTQSFKVFEYFDSLTWVKGRHILKFGAQIRYWQPLFTDSQQYQGTWSFTGINTQNPAKTTGTGDGFADWMLGFPASATRAFPGNWFGGQSTSWHFFVQDDFKVSSRLTLNIGLRYEYTPWLSGYRGQLGTFDSTQSKPIIIASDSDKIDLGAQFAAPLAYSLFGQYMQTSSQAGLPLSITSPDKAQWAPRFGFAWRPFGDHTVLRGGYGIFYETENTDGRVNDNMLPFRFSETVNATANTVPNRTLADFFLGQPLGSLGVTPNLSPTYTHLKEGSDQHWNIGIQQQLTANTVLEADYVGNHSLHLNSSNSIDNPLPGPGAIQARRPLPLWSSISYFSQDMSSTYNALQVKFEKRSSHGLWYMASYTWSKSFTTQATPAVGGNFAWEKGISSFDIPQNLALSVSYELPFGRGKTFLSNSNRLTDGLLGGWQMQTSTVIRSGRPYTPTISRDVANTGIGGQRPNRVGSGTLSDPTAQAWFDKTAFVVPDSYTYGNSGVDILREQRFFDIDFSVFKQFNVSERGKLQFRAEFFNLTNTVSFSAPNTNIDTASGGVVSSDISVPRQIQFALKYNF